MPIHKRFKCRFCGRILPAWWPVAQVPDGAMLLYHLGDWHPDDVGAYLARIHRTEDISPVAAEAFEVVEEEERR
jgi:hypothetical protein